MSNLTKPEIGTISHGTLRPEDLIPAFLGTLRDCSPAHAARIVHDHGEDFIESCVTGLGPQNPSEFASQSYLLDDLFDALSDIAPEGAYFGTIEGDGSDFGFWQNDEEE